MPEPLIKCRGLTRVYVQGKIQIHALRDLDIDMQSGEFLALIGPSGCGKTTLLNLIGGLDVPTSGEVTIAGRKLSKLNRSERAELRLQEIGFVFQSYNLLPVLSAVENIEFILQLQGMAVRERRQRALAILEDVGLLEMADRRPGELSGGQQQRVAVARAIVTRPQLLLADEPSANLDSAATAELLQLLTRMNEKFGTTIVTATHDGNVMRYVRRLVAMKDGRIERDQRLETH